MAIINKEGFDFYDNLNGKPETLILKGLVLDKELEYINKHRIKSISLECPTLTELDFLERIDFVEDITLSNSFTNYQGLYSLGNLRKLMLNIGSKGSLPDISLLKELEILSIDWCVKFPDLSVNEKLKEISIWKFKPKCKSFEKLKLPLGLEMLKITESNIVDFKGFFVPNLKHFEGHYCNYLQSLNGLESASNHLEILILDYCRKLSDYNKLKECKHLKKIILGDCGNIPSLKWLNGMNNVNHFSFWNTKVIDGDVSPCFGINYVNFKNSRHYNHKLEEFI